MIFKVFMETKHNFPPKMRKRSYFLDTHDHLFWHAVEFKTIRCLIVHVNLTNVFHT